jgi:hypothetical protein
MAATRLLNRDHDGLVEPIRDAGFSGFAADVCRRALYGCGSAPDSDRLSPGVTYCCRDGPT